MQKQQKGQRSNNDDDFSNDETMSRNDQTASRRQSTASSMSIASNHTFQNDFKNNNYNGPTKPQQESIFNLLGKNLAANTIYEEDEDQTNHHRQQNQRNQANNFNQNEPTQRNQSQVSNHQQQHNKNVNSGLEDFSDTGFVPFMRTNEFLDPTHAGSPIPPSRESSAVKENREKARQVF